MRRTFVLFISLCLTLLTGCALVQRRGTAPDVVAAGREHSLQGMAAIERGDWSRAEPLLRQAIEASPNDAHSRRYLAEALWQRGAAHEALTHILAAARSDEADAAITVRAGEMSLAIASTDDALAHANQAIRRDPRLPSAWTLRGRVFRQMNQPSRALADLHQALEYAPNDRQILFDIAETYRQVGQPTRSLTTLHQLLDTYPPNEEPQQALYLEGLLLHELGRGRQATECLLAASRRGPPRAEIFHSLAQVQAALGEYDSATATAQQALAIDASHAPSRSLLTQLASRTTPPEPQRR